MHHTPLSFLLLFIAAYLSDGISPLGAQTLEWRYEFDYTLNTMCGDLLVDENENVFANVSTRRPDDSYRGGGMIALDAHGRFNGMIMMNNPLAEATFAPFGKGRYISSQWGESRIYDAQGNLIESGKGFGGNYFARVTTPKGHVYFSKPLDHFKASYITIGKVSNHFQFDQDSISLQPIAIEGLGISLTYEKPAMTENGIWIVPFKYGKVNGAMSVEHSIVAAIKNEKILWTFPKSLTDYPVIACTAEGDRIGVVLKALYRTNQFCLLDPTGQKLTQFDFQVTGNIVDVRMNQQKVSILTSYGLYIYTMEGVQVDMIPISNDFLIDPTEFEWMDNGDYIIAGNFQGQVTVIRISMPEQDIPERPNDKVESRVGGNIPDDPQVTNPVSQVTLQTISDETISASVFPNPASLYINFELKNGPAFRCTIAVFDGSGKLLHEDAFEGNQYRLALDQFVPGNYFYRLQSSSGQEKILSGIFVKI